MSEAPTDASARPQQELIIAFDRLSSIALKDIDRKTALRECVQIACSVLRSEVCAALLVDLKTNSAEHVGCAGPREIISHLCDRRLRLVTAPPPGVPLERGALQRDPIERGTLIERYDLGEEGFGNLASQVARQFRLTGVLGHPLRSETGVFGYLLHFTAHSGPFTDQERTLIEMISRHISITVERLESVVSRRRLQRLNTGMQRLAEATREEDLYESLLQVGMGLVAAPRGALALVEPLTGGMRLLAPGSAPALSRRDLQPGQGVASAALRRETTLVIDDIRQPTWQGVYTEVWSETRAELAAPIVLPNAAVRQGREVNRASRRFGVLNLESPDVGAFSQIDADILWSLVRYAAVLLDHLETERKQRELAKAHQAILASTDWNATIDLMMTAIDQTLSYPYVNVSLVQADRGSVKTEYVRGIVPGEVERFRSLADHRLDSNDIQAHIVRARTIEAPAPGDPRFDPNVYDRFGHKDYRRVFLPMIAPSDDRVIGTLEAGFRRNDHREHIYEEDVQILKAFVDYAASALDRFLVRALEEIDHELRAPINGIRNNARFMQRHISDLRHDVVQHKYDDMITDCDILLSQVARLEHILGKPQPIAPRVPTIVFRDVVIKTARQLETEARYRNLRGRGFEYDNADIERLGTLWVDPARLGQVFLNLLVNCVKYADPADEFHVRMLLEESSQDWLLHVQDWGIGIKPEYTELVFRDRFRTPEAQARNPTGSGLGLTIARSIMREIGGDLLLTGICKPTEFVVRLPKSLARKP